jgi:hypothetical protein
MLPADDSLFLWRRVEVLPSESSSQTDINRIIACMAGDVAKGSSQASWKGSEPSDYAICADDSHSTFLLSGWLGREMEPP